MAFAEYNLFGLFINSAGNILSAHSFGKLHLLASCFCLAVVYVLLKAICSGFMQVRTALPWEHRSPKTDIQLQCSWTLTRRENRAEKLVLSEFNNKKKKKKQNRLWWWGYFFWLQRDLVWGICSGHADLSHLAIKHHWCEWEGAKMTARASWWGEVPAPDLRTWRSICLSLHSFLMLLCAWRKKKKKNKKAGLEKGDGKKRVTASLLPTDCCFRNILTASPVQQFSSSLTRRKQGGMQAP